MDQLSDPEVKTSNDQGSSARSEHMDEELDGLPVFGADEDDWDMDSSSNQVDSQCDRNADDKNESQDRAQISSVEAVEKNSCSTSGSSETDEERMKACEEHSVTPLSDAVIGVQDTHDSTHRDSDQITAARYTDKETCCSPVIQIKDEPIDEDYDKALLPQPDIGNIKQESESNENESLSLSDELKISSVFSVSGNNADAVSVMSQSASLRGAALVLPAQPPAQLQPRPATHAQPQLHPHIAVQAHVQAPPMPQVHAPSTTVRICCSGCSKVLQKGQTAFQRKGSNQLFCSTVCLTSFSLPSVQFTPIIAPKKTCHLCLKVIVNLKDLITIPVGSMNTLKEFCSQACLSVYKDRYRDAAPDTFTQCSVCKQIKEIQHEVTHLGVVHKLCSDDCFARFRSSRNLYMSYCENCGNCTASGNYHLVQLEDSIRKFCTIDCINTYKQKSGKRLQCPCCQEMRNIEEMMDGTNVQGVTEFFCSQGCVAKSQASPSLTGASFPCTSCKKFSVPQYHLAISDGSIRNFCSLDCVGKFQDKMNASVPHHQMNGASQEPQNLAALQPPTEGHPVPHTSSSVPDQSQNAAPAAAACAMTSQQGVGKTRAVSSRTFLVCMQCRGQFNGRPEVFQFKSHSGVFCTRACCDVYKRENNVKAVCEYCRLEKVVKDVITYERQLRCFCCEGCKLLFKHDLAKRQGVQFRFCAHCQNMTHKMVQNFFGGKLEEFCTEECMSQYTVLFYEMAKCYGCRHQGSLKETLVLNGSKKHFCDINCVMMFCSKGLACHQPRHSSVPHTTTAQAPLSVSQDMPVIGGVVSLASVLAGNTAVTGALPTSHASSKIIGEASTQTDAAVPGTPHRRTLKNKALMCRPFTEEQAVQCQPARDPPPNRSEMGMDENGKKVRLVPFLVPVPMPVYIPVPVHLYTQFTPSPLGLPIPVPVPLLIPGSQEHQGSLPAQSSVDDDEGEKGKDKPDQGSANSGHLESEARSTPFSWADTEEPGANVKQVLPSGEAEEPPETSASLGHPDLEVDFPRSAADPRSAKENSLVLSLKRRRKGRDGVSARKRGRTRSGPEASGEVWLSACGSKLNHMYGVSAWASWVQKHTCKEGEPQCSTVKQDVLQCSSKELSHGLCRFIKEVRRPNGEVYEPDSVYYLCLGIQQCLLENGRLENIFTDSLYSHFISDITALLKDWGNSLPPGGYIHSRIEEDYLWECKQLGALSPIVLLNTLLFFGAKMLNLKTVEQHQRLTFSNVTHCTKATKTGVTSYLKFKLPDKEDAVEMRAGRSRREGETVDEEFMEMPENSENPLRCPVRLYQFYLSKCSDSVKQRPDLFYLQPESLCHPSSPVWYSAQPLERSMMDSMITRNAVVRAVHQNHTQHKKPNSSDEESS